MSSANAFNDALTDHHGETPIDMAELRRYRQGNGATDAALESAVQEVRRLTLAWSDGRTGQFPLMWLRDHCACDQCRHPLTRERLYKLLDDPLWERFATDEALAAFEFDDRSLTLTWQDGHVSRFDAGWLHQRCPGHELTTLLPTATPWVEAFTPAHVSHADFVGNGDGRSRWASALLRDGLVMLDQGPCELEEVSRIAESIGPMRSTNFGGRFDVRSVPNPNNAAYTAIGLELHTDLPNWRQPPDIQLLYCLENDAEGGESSFADGFAVAEILREENPEAFRVLSETPIDFRFQDDGHDIAVREPVIDLDGDGRPREIRFNNWIRDTLSLPADRIEAWYEAYRAFWQILRRPERRVELTLEPGQMIAFDNRRVLHGRNAFDPNTGKRHLQGTYLDLDMLQSHLRVLSR
ncbi:gamma-butyrobetaine,2-oxoglutarate dioxygenase [Salinicola sp. MH3R3-1]|uniref:TauD/TfdA family dioxygenase n=1 Tax=Salinicola sp. MH3R3-1 TaxID=1928762 RepID=UPI00094F10E9|nr:TauD/TfdA family dioxygenase [Salinicola sp. MH3R3-1]OLO09161.1 gamma-butyrobetaine,2-oxoglutarate dioxygenase [Salinicola sp. MH3R3-1]